MARPPLSPGAALAMAGVAVVCGTAAVATADQSILFNFDNATSASAPATFITTGITTGTTTSGGTITKGTFDLGNSSGPVSGPINTSSMSSGSYTTAAGTVVTASAKSNFGNAVDTGVITVDTDTTAYLSLVLSGLSPSSTYSFSELDFLARSSGTGPRNLQVYANAASGTTFTSVAAVKNQANSGSGYVGQVNALTLSVSGRSAVEFRIYTYNGTGSAGVGSENFRIDDLSVVYNATAVPEPTSLLLAGVAAAPLIAGRRRRQRAVA